MPLRWCFYLIVFLPVCFLHALDPDRSITQHLTETFSASAGLPLSSIEAIEQSDDGYLWVGSQSGIARFNGIDFFAIDSSYFGDRPDIIHVRALKSSGSVLWIGSFGNGIIRYDRAAGTYTFYQRESGLSDLHIRSFAYDNSGTLWAGTQNNGLFRLSGEKFIPSATDLGLKTVSAIRKHPDGSLFLATKDTFIVFGKDSLFSRCDAPGVVSAITLDSDGKVFAAVDKKGLYLFEPGNCRFTLLPASSCLAENAQFMDIISDREKNIWLLDRNRGLYKLSSGRQCTEPEPVHAVLLGETLFEDREGLLWVGSQTAGLQKIKDAPVVTFTTGVKELPDAFYSLAEMEDSSFVIGSVGAGILRFDGRKITKLDYSGLPSGSAVLSVAVTKDTLWAAYYSQGIYTISGTTVRKFIAEPSIGEHPSVLYADADETLWAGTFDNGLFHISGTTVSAFGVREGLPQNEISAIARSRSGSLYVSVRGIGVFRMEKVRFVPVTAVNEQCGTHIQSIVETASGSMIFSAPNRICIENGGKISTLSPKNGLLRAPVYSMSEDSGGNWWFSTGRGIMRYQAANITDFIAGKNSLMIPQIFGMAEGMYSAECNGGTVYRKGAKTTNLVLFPTMNGLSVIDTRKLEHKGPGPRINIEHILIDSEKQPVTRQIDIAPGSKKLEIEYATLSYHTPQNNRSRYILEGFDKDWNEAPGNARASYTNLAPGTYRFLVSGFSANGVSDTDHRMLEITVQRPFYTSWLFIFAILAVIAATMGYLVFLRIKKEQLRQNELERELIKSEKRYEKNRLDDLAAKSYMDAITRLMEQEKIYLDQTLSLQKMAERLSISHFYLSQIMNLHFNQPFTSYITAYRIEEAKRLLRDPVWKDKAVLEIAYQCGFTSKSTFNTAFKKLTGQTPSEYRGN